MKCKIDGCGRDAMYQKDQVCQKHYFRFMRFGTYDLTMKPRKASRVHSAGYICLFIPNHPLANSTGEVYEHRKVIYDKYGDDLPDCELCGKETSWHPYTTHIDPVYRGFFMPVALILNAGMIKALSGGGLVIKGLVVHLSVLVELCLSETRSPRVHH